MPVLRDALLTDLKRLAIWTRRCLLALLVSTTGWFLCKGIINYTQTMHVFDLRRIEVRGNNILRRAEVIDAMNLPLTGSIFETDLSALQRRVEALNYVYGVRLGRKFPHTLFVDIVENDPIAYVAAPEYFILTDEEEALPLPRGRFDLVLPTVTGADSALEALNQGTIEDHGQLQQAWSILDYIHRSFPGLFKELSELVFTPNGEITLYMAETSTAVHLGGEELELRIALLDAFLHTIVGKKNLMDYSYIDLRYERQVIVRERA
ncbi:MAG: FtsQ-type POTRA domain-containing protein [Fidelibacterota bacterium]|nr:MAG: FtsQ-type POTRA domain-containing protein [Candidatus Neomarinimicrobiota bacterium]